MLVRLFNVTQGKNIELPLLKSTTVLDTSIDQEAAALKLFKTMYENKGMEVSVLAVLPTPKPQDSLAKLKEYQVSFVKGLGDMKMPLPHDPERMVPMLDQLATMEALRMNAGRQGRAGAMGVGTRMVNVNGHHRWLSIYNLDLIEEVKRPIMSEKMYEFLWFFIHESNATALHNINLQGNANEAAQWSTLLGTTDNIHNYLGMLEEIYGALTFK